MLLSFIQWRSQWSCEVLWSHASESPTCSRYNKPHPYRHKPCVQAWASPRKSRWSNSKKSMKALKEWYLSFTIHGEDKLVNVFCPSTFTSFLLQVSELRQQLRKRGLPVSGTKPALLQRLRLFQLPHSCLTPAPLCQLSTSLEPLTTCPPLPPNQSPGSSSSSGQDSPSSSPNQQMYVQDRGVPNGTLSDTQNGVQNGNLNNVPNGFSSAASVSLAGEHCLSNAVFLTPASTASGTPSPSLPMSSSSPLQCGTPWRTDNEQQQQQQQELSVELEMRERLRSRPRDRSTNIGDEVSKDRLGS